MTAATKGHVWEILVNTCGMCARCANHGATLVP